MAAVMRSAHAAHLEHLMRHRSHLADRWAEPFVMRWEKSILLTMNALIGHLSGRDERQKKKKASRKRRSRKGRRRRRTHVLTSFEVLKLSCGVIVKYDYWNGFDSFALRRRG